MTGAHLSHYDGMLNAGFCALIITVMAEAATPVGQERSAGCGLPWSTIYLLAPMALHKRTAVLISKSRNLGLAEFMSGHPELTLGLDLRIMNISSYIRSGFLMALRMNCIRLDSTRRNLVATDSFYQERELRMKEILGDEDYKCIRASRRLGEWAANISEPEICRTLHVHPIWFRSFRDNNNAL